MTTNMPGFVTGPGNRASLILKKGKVRNIQTLPYIQMNWRMMRAESQRVTPFQRGKPMGKRTAPQIVQSSMTG